MPINYTKPIEIRDARNGSWFWVHTHLLKDPQLHPYDKIVYALLASYASQTQTAFPSVERLSKEAGISKRRIHQSIKQLEIRKYIQVERIKGQHNIYTLCKTKPTSAGGALVQEVHPTSARSDTTTSARGNTITISNELDLPNNSEDVEKIIHWAYKRAEVTPSISKDMFLQSLNKAIDRVGYKAIYEVFAEETNAIRFLQIIKSL